MRYDKYSGIKASRDVEESSTSSEPILDRKPLERASRYT